MVNMKRLDRKLLRDLWTLKAQALAIALVMASGVATLVMMLSTVSSLRSAQQSYYEHYRFAHVFTHLKRAPDALAVRRAALPGVAPVADAYRRRCYPGSAGHDRAGRGTIDFPGRGSAGGAQPAAPAARSLSGTTRISFSASTGMISKSPRTILL
jgi:hypothetical protein